MEETNDNDSQQQQVTNPLDDLPNIIGLTRDEALAKVAPTYTVLRPLQLDGIQLMGTMELRSDRINVAVKDGKITEVLSIG